MKTVQCGVTLLSTVCFSSTSLTLIKTMKGSAQYGSTEYIHAGIQEKLIYRNAEGSHLTKTVQCGVALLSTVCLSNTSITPIRWWRGLHNTVQLNTYVMDNWNTKKGYKPNNWQPSSRGEQCANYITGCLIILFNFWADCT